METPEQAQERQLPPHFSRELGRAITFLSRGRKRFMAERLRELGFSGAGGFNADWDVVGFRQRMDGGWDFFLQYKIPMSFLPKFAVHSLHDILQQ